MVLLLKAAAAWNDKLCYQAVMDTGASFAEGSNFERNA